MASKTYAGLTAASDVQDADLFASWRSTGPLKSVLASVVVTYLAGKFGSLASANTWAGALTISASNATTLTDYVKLKPTDYGVGKPGLFISKNAGAMAWFVSVYDGATVAGQIDIDLTLLLINGNFTVLNATSLLGGLTVTGTTKSSVTAMAALSINWAANDVQTKSISANSTFTFTGFTASTAQSILLFLTISSSAVPSWPASVKYGGGVNPSASLGNGTHLLGLTTPDGGTTVVLTVGSKAFA